ncbi:MAG: DUF2182 domain-containing protein [Rhizobiaceae bacterium]
MAKDNNSFDHLDRVGRTVAAIAHPAAATTLTALAFITIASWVLLAGMSASLPALEAGPGAGLLDWLELRFVPWPLDTLLALCLTPVLPDAGNLPLFVSLLAMWFIMSLAMMLPSAAPLVRTYCEIADTARAAGKSVVHPMWLLSGFLGVWLLASAGFALVALAVSRFAFAGIASPAVAPVSVAALVIAGAYQFSSLKESCLKKCRNPFSTLFGNWSFDTLRIVKLGVAQGLWCLGCCWALMLIMFVVGVMNIFWMALLTAFMVLEKLGSGKTLSRIAGVILLVWGFSVLLVAV